MYFTNPEIVEWNVKNNSSASISNILCWFGLFDLDQPFITPSPVVPSAPFNPLPITVQKIDFINPDIPVGAVLLPTNLINRIKTGDRIVGLAGFSYPNGKEKVYWIYILHVQGKEREWSCFAQRGVHKENRCACKRIGSRHKWNSRLPGAKERPDRNQEGRSVKENTPKGFSVPSILLANMARLTSNPN